MEKNFSPLVFLASLGAGGIAIMPFVLMQYTLEHGKGLIVREQLWNIINTNFLTSSLYYFLEFVMIFFSLIHIFLTIFFSIKLYKWIKTKEFKELINDPLRNATILAPLISILMTMNVFIGVIRYFFPVVSNNFQQLFLPAMIFWSILFFMIMYLEIKLLSISFKKGFDIEKINFGWLLHPFVLGMLSVVGSGIAAMSKNSTIANLASFMTLISFSMGIFLLLVKMIVLFKSHFSAQKLPEKHFLPSFLIVIPNITLYAITLFRLGHFLETHQGFHLGPYFYIIMGFAFAFEIWYLLFGLTLLFDYFKKDHFKDFYVTQWGFICPIVAFGVLGGFVYKLILPYTFFYIILVLSILVAIIFYFELLIKHFKCFNSKNNKLNCQV